MRPKPQKNYSRVGRKRVTGASKSLNNKKCTKSETSIIAIAGASTRTTGNGDATHSLLRQDLSQDEQKPCSTFNHKNSYAYSHVPKTNSGGDSTTMILGADSSIGIDYWCSHYDPPRARVITPPFLKNNARSCPVAHHVDSQGATAVLSDGTPTNKNVYPCSYVPPPPSYAPSIATTKPRSSTLDTDCNVFVQDATNKAVGRAQNHHFTHVTTTARNNVSDSYCAGMMLEMPPIRHESSLFPHPFSILSCPNEPLSAHPHRKPQFALGRPNLFSERTGAPPLFPSSRSSTYAPQEPQQQQLMVVPPPTCHQYHGGTAATTQSRLGRSVKQDFGLIFASGSPHSPSAAGGQGTPPSFPGVQVSATAAPGTSEMGRVMMYY